MLTGGLEERVSAYDVGLDEGSGAIDGTVHMGLGGQMHDPIRMKICEGGTHGVGITDVRLEQAMGRMAIEIGERARVAGIGELVDVENLVASGDKQSDEIGADETGTACDENAHGGKAEG